MPIWLVGQGHPSEKYEFVNWDDEIPNIWENKIHGNQTTNQQYVGLVNGWEIDDQIIDRMGFLSFSDLKSTSLEMIS